TLPSEAASVRQLLPWALREPGAEGPALRAMLANQPGNQAGAYLIARQDIEGYNADIESRGAILMAYYFANLYSSKAAGHAMLRDPRVKAMVVRFGFPGDWRGEGWAAGRRRRGAGEFQCGGGAV